MSHVVYSETGMAVARLMAILDKEDKQIIQVRFKGKPDSEDNLEQLQRVHGDVPTMLQNILSRNSTPTQLENRARR